MNGFRTFWASSVLSLIMVAQGALGEETKQRDEIFSSSSVGWYWVYEGVAHAQSFLASGCEVEAVRLRVAQLNGLAPAARLEIEIRDETLQEIYVQGSVAPEQVGKRFEWVTAKLEHRAVLQKGTPYVLLLHSGAAEHNAPWLINATFRNVYSNGRHLGYRDDLFFSISFEHGLLLHVGPSLSAEPVAPLNTGKKGGSPVSCRPRLCFGGRVCPTIAAHDPLGPIPEAKKSGMVIASK